VDAAMPGRLMPPSCAVRCAIMSHNASSISCWWGP
jgi:hypothetical protein